MIYLRVKLYNSFLRNIIMDYSALIPYKVKDVVSIIIENKNLSFIDSIEYLYHSKMYEYLSDETTKFWHLSPNKLYDILEREKNNLIFDIPDFI